jgi:hypothetical protein
MCWCYDCVIFQRAAHVPAHVLAVRDLFRYRANQRLSAATSLLRTDIRGEAMSAPVGRQV